MKTLLTGGSGFLGSALCRDLVEAHNDPTGGELVTLPGIGRTSVTRLPARISRSAQPVCPLNWLAGVAGPSFGLP